MTLCIIDHGEHGDIVMDTAGIYYEGDILTIDLGTNSPDFGEVTEAVESATEHDLSAVNLSYGSANTERPDTMLGRDYTEAVRELWSDDTVVTVAAGNRGEEYGDSLGVSWLAASPWVFSVSALNGQSPAAYSQWSPLMTTIWADGYSMDYGVQGTSICAPLVCGLFGSLKDEHGLTNAEILTAYEQTADHFVGSGFHHWRINGVESFHQWKLDETAMAGIDGTMPIDEEVIIDGAYEVFLGRQPDEVGLSYWSRQADVEQAISSMIDIAYEANDSNNFAVPVMERVQGLYHTLLHREADMAGMTYWIDRVLEYYDEVYYLSMGEALWGHVAQEFASSAEQNGEHVFNLDEVALLAQESRANEIPFGL
jgi:hypothetical protein